MGSVHDRRHLLTHDDQAVDCLGQPEMTSDASLVAKRGAIQSSPMGCCRSDFRPIRMFCLGWGGTLRTVSSEEKCVFTENNVVDRTQTNASALLHICYDSAWMTNCANTISPRLLRHHPPPQRGPCSSILVRSAHTAAVARCAASAAARSSASSSAEMMLPSGRRPRVFASTISVQRAV